MELRDLQALVHISEAGSLSGAAYKLNLTQPALSALVRRLEDELDTQILYRHSRGVNFTEEGTFLLERAHHMIAEMLSIQSSLQDLGEEPNGVVRVGLPTSLASGLIPFMLRRLNDQYPRIHLHITEQMSGNLTEMLQLGHLDMAILFHIQPMYGLRSEPLLSEEIKLLLGRDDPMACHDSVSLQEIADRELVLPSASHSIRKVIDRAAATEGIKLRVCADLDSFFGLVNAAQVGFPTLLPIFLVQRHIEDGRIKCVGIDRPRMTWNLHLANRLDSIRPRAAMIVRRAITEICSDLITKGNWPGKLHPYRTL
jgi:LysR family nitrogen assimilation transcriptional regulator